MNFNPLGKSEIKVSEIGFGVLTIGHNQLNLPLEKGAELINYALDRGINFFDTAQFYKTYPYLKMALKSSNKEAIIASKCLESSYKAMEFAVEECRRELDRDVIDIFLLHEVREGEDLLSRIGAWDYLNRAKAKGIVKSIGISTHHVDVAEVAARMPELDILFPLINYKSLGIRNGRGFGSKEEMEIAISNNISAGKGVFAMKVFGGGNLTSQYLPALNYVHNIPGISSMMLGFGSIKEVDNAIDFAEGKLPVKFQPDVSQKKMRIDSGDCEACGACIKKCPNTAIKMSKEGIAEIITENCLTCGYCAPVCPTRALIML
ncbi:MAG: aldo/keto reductase [Anaerovoracaceae bacterium]